MKTALIAAIAALAACGLQPHTDSNATRPSEGAPPIDVEPQNADDSDRFSYEVAPAPIENMFVSLSQRECQVSSDCAVVAIGSPCKCDGYGAIARSEADRFLAERASRAHQCPAEPPVCTPNPAEIEPFCHHEVCYGRHPRDLACVDEVLQGDSHNILVQPGTHPAIATPGVCAWDWLAESDATPYGQETVFHFRPTTHGKYSMLLSSDGAAPRYVYVRGGGDCVAARSETCQVCGAGDRRCSIPDLVTADPDRDMLIAVRNCNSTCQLRIQLLEAFTE